jgi:hypothetical protein
MGMHFRNFFFSDVQPLDLMLLYGVAVCHLLGSFSISLPHYTPLFFYFLFFPKACVIVM